MQVFQAEQHPATFQAGLDGLSSQAGMREADLADGAEDSALFFEDFDPFVIGVWDGQ